MALNTYEISFRDFSADRDEFPFGRLVICGRQQAKNGIEAIKAQLLAKGVEQADIDTGRSIGSIKRFVLAGITFEANKVRS